MKLFKCNCRQAILDKHYLDMKRELEESKTLEDIKNDDFEKVQDYFHDISVEKSRMAFKVRSHMVPEIPGNLKNRYRNTSEGLVCKYCQGGKIMTQDHCLECPAWEELRRGLEMSNIYDTVSLLYEVACGEGKVGSE